MCINVGILYKIIQGRRPMGTVPLKNLRWGTAHASVPPNILRSSVVGCVRKYEDSKNRVKKCHKGILF